MNRSDEFQVLVVDDEEGMRFSLEKTLTMEGYSVATAATGKAALDLLSRRSFHLAFIDLQLPDLQGIELLPRLDTSAATVVVITAFATVATAVQAMKLGAADYLQKPFDLRDVVEIAQRGFGRRRQDSSKAPAAQNEGGDGFVAASARMKEVLGLIRKVQDSEIPVLLLGESGTGKEMVARLVHEGTRRDRPFIAINCAAIPRELLESELFGHEKGTFTGAAGRKVGKFEAAEDGTIFLDEIGDMDFSLQTKLLRALEERCFEPVGSNKPVRLRARIVASTNQDLQEMMRKKQFRVDLYYRLKGLSITLPALRDRREDIAPLLGHFLERYRTCYAKPGLTMARETVRFLEDYPWPGNIRELKNAVESAVLLSEGGRPLLPQDFSLEGLQEQGQESDLSSVERQSILAALKIAGFNRSLAAKELGVSRKTLYNKLKKYSLS